ncbi:MAG: cell division protein ZapA [Magnetococcales bacterium]|nr:cell division protein ZapA [Magnetococcales bacterium]NGZ27314.1 cell division protein ZapA [Magnetococcales bacterium]
MSNSVEVKIHGQSFRLRTEADELYVRELQSLVEGVISDLEQLGRKSRTVDSHRIALMAALQIADDYLQLKRQVEGSKAEVQQRVHALVQNIDRLLE